MPGPLGQRASLPAGRWTKVLWGWGWYSINYSVTVSAPGCEYRTYAPPLPWPSSSGKLSATGSTRIEHAVRGYGDVWFFSPVNATYTLTPVSREPLNDF